MGAHERMSFDKAHRDVTVIRAEKHPQFIENSGTDIAILYLDEDVKFTGKQMCTLNHSLKIVRISI